MKIAVIADTGKEQISFPDETFRKLLKEYLDRGLTVDQAFDSIIVDLKRELLYK